MKASSNQTVGRYDPCPCGSGEKYKFCCEQADRARQKRVAPLPLAVLPDLYDGIERVTDADGQELMLLGYEITGEPVEDRGDGVLPPDVQDHAADFFDQARNHPLQAIPRLEPLVERYPRVPALKNWLMVAYQQAGRTADADTLSERIYREHPDYFFGRIAQAYGQMQRGELDKVPETLGGLDLKLIYPERNVFHISEALSLWALLADWYYLRGEEDEALDLLDRMMEIAPDHELTKRTELLLMPVILLEAVEGMLQRRPSKQVKSKSKSKSKPVLRKRIEAGARESGNSPDDVDPAPLRVPRNAC